MSASLPPPAAPGSAGLDWRDSTHWSAALLPCVHCRNATNLRDDDGRPSHKVCAEADIAEDPGPGDPPAIGPGRVVAAEVAA